MNEKDKKYRVELRRYTPLTTPITKSDYVYINIPDYIIEEILKGTNSEDSVANRILADMRIFKN